MNIKSLLNGKVIGIVIAGASAVAAFASEVESQKKEKAFKELTEKVAELEKKTNS